MRVRSLKLADRHFGNQWASDVVDRWEYEDMRKSAEWRTEWISFDCALYEPEQDRVYCGITSFDADIFKAYDRRRGEFVDLGYGRIADPFDAKFHRSLVKSQDGSIYAAVALLHDVDRYWDAPGGAVVKYDPVSGAIAKLAIPVPHTYIQAIALDDERRVLYCLCFAPEKLASLNLRTGETCDIGLLGTGIGGMVQGENLVIDDDGCVWSGWGLTRAWQTAAGADSFRLCKYDPRKGAIEFFPRGLPQPNGKYGTVRVEGLFNFHDGFIYASAANGSFYRVEPDTGKAMHLFTPVSDRPSRLTSLVETGDGGAYGVTGREGKCEFMRVDYRRGTFEKMGTIEDEDGVALWQCHHIVYAGTNTFYLCENDNPYRSGYLWELSL